jgi:hypothetical protein
MKFVKLTSARATDLFVPEGQSSVTCAISLNNGPGVNSVEADVLVSAWNRATRRQLFFFDPPIDTGDLSKHAPQLLQAYTENRAYHWAEDPSTMGPTSIFPRDGDKSFDITEYNIVLFDKGGDKVRFSDLTSFQAVWAASDETIVFTKADHAWGILDPSGEISIEGNLRMCMGSSARFPAGALKFTLKIDQHSREPDFSSRTLVGMAYAKVKEDEHGEELDIAYQTGNFFRHLKSVAAGLHFDPRDNIYWGSEANNITRDHTFRSRITFPPAKDGHLVTNIFSDRGLRLAVKPSTDNEGVGILGIRYAYGQIDSSLLSTWALVAGGTYFGLDGDFVVSALAAEDDAILDPKDYPIHCLLGMAATDFVTMKIGHTLRFARNKPGVLLTKQHRIPPHAFSEVNLLHDGAHGRMATSWMTVIPSKKGKDDPVYHTEPEKAPLFQSQGPKDRPLVRTNPPFGAVKEALLPMFPWMGEREALPGPMGRDSADIYETSHLAAARRRLLEPLFKSRKGLFAKGRKAPKTESLSVTPQGVIASVAGNGGSYSKLYFGSSELDNGPEFQIELVKPNTEPEEKVYEAVQRELRSESLFLVFHEATEAARKVVKPATTIKVDGFEIKVDFTNAKQKETLIVKYVKGRSLKDLAGDLSVWACKEFLAPSATEATLATLAHLPDSIGSSTWKNNVWESPDWQGVLLLNFLPAGTPELFEALGAGMDGNLFRFHHFGFKFLPVKSGDLAGTAPKRTGSAFGLLRYKEGGKPPDIDSNDEEPTSKKAAQKRRKSGQQQRDYYFTVKSVEVLFVNSRVDKFAAEVDVGFRRLFWDPTDAAEPGKMIPLLGWWDAADRDSEGTTERFRLVTKEETLHPVTFRNSWINRFDCQQVELVAVKTEPNAISPKKTEPRRKVTFALTFKGDLCFDYSKQPFKEWFEIKKVKLDKFGLQLDYYPPSGGLNKEVYCRFKADSIHADIDFGGLRSSLLSIFPVKLKGFRVAVGELLDLDKLKFLSLGDTKKFHFAFDLELDLGFLGKLMGPAKGLKIPLLLGWQKGGAKFGLGIQFPKWDGKKFEIGIQQFVSIRAESAVIVPCKDGDTFKALAIKLSTVKLIIFGREWPAADFDLAIFVPANGQQKLAWAFGRKATSKDEWFQYLGGGYRIKLPNLPNDAKEIVTTFKEEFGDKGGDPCELIADADRESWMVVAEIVIEEMVEAWLALVDTPSLYAFRLKIAKVFDVGAAYRRINDELGVFSAEVNLAEIIPPLQFGVATVRLPSIRTEVYTDGGWLIDLGYPWNNNFRRSFQLEVGIFLGSGGVYLGYTAAEAASVLAIEDGRYGFRKPAPGEGWEGVRALRAGIALRVGIGRSIDLGVLKGEASITVYGALEGAMSFAKGGKTTAQYYAIAGKTGVMVQIWAELDFIVLQARAEICAYAEMGFELRRVLGYKEENGKRQYYAIELPFTVFVQVGIYVHFEVWVTIGCIQVKLFDLSFSATWRVEETFGKFETESLDGKSLGLGLPEPIETPDGWDPRILRAYADQTPEELYLYAMVTPCVADPGDLGTHDSTVYQSCLVAHLLLEVNDKDHGVLPLAKFMVAWALGLANPSDYKTITRAEVRANRDRLRDNKYWEGKEGEAILMVVEQRFRAVVKEIKNKGDEKYLGVPAWPGISWGFDGEEKAEPQQILSNGRGVVRNGTLDPVDNVFLDFMRLVTESFLAESDRQIRLNRRDTMDPRNADMKWGELWEAIAKRP